MTEVIHVNQQYIIRQPDANVLGRGGMGTVYRGEDVQSGQPVAIKQLHPDFRRNQPETVQRFIREGEALRQLNHPNIVKLLEAVETADHHYLIMEYVPGGSLQDLLDEKRPLPLAQITQIGLELADALTRAHHLGIIHRDLKPANVLLAEDGTPRLTDFGIARVGDGRELTQTGEIVGTVSYLSPEACEGQTLDARTDIWSFGVMLFEMVGGERPFTGDTLTAVLTAILTQPVPDLNQHRPHLPGTLVRLIERMLTKDREQRMGSIRQVAFELEASKQSEPPQVTAWGKIEREKAVKTIPGQVAPVTAVLSAERRKQLILLQKVKSAWVQGVLEKSLLDRTLIGLTRQRQDDLVDRPWDNFISADEGNTTLPTMHHNSQLFTETDRALLILGTPGAGKTTSLIGLARDFITLAEMDPSQPIPVILNLASWAEQRGNLADWVVEELTAKYQIPRQLGRAWLAEDQLLLLLDGLDEVQSDQQSACVLAINQFRETHGLTGLVVCCRLEEYQALSIRLKLGGAVCLQPLTLAQVDDYLAKMGSRLAALRTAVQQDSTLQEMAQSPLMLSIMTLAYSHEDEGQALAAVIPSNWADEDTHARRQHLFATYVQRMFQRRGTDANYSPEQTKQWLSWLAQKLSQHNQTVFLIEQLQPSWLESRPSRWLYMLMARLIGGFVIAFVTWLLIRLGQLNVPLFEIKTFQALGTRYQVSLLVSVLILIPQIGGLVGLIDIFYFERRQQQQNEAQIDPRQGWQHLATVVFVIGIVVVLVMVFLFDDPLPLALFGAAFEATCFVLGFGYVKYGQSYRTDIQTVEALSWSWAKAIRGIIPGIIIGSITGLAFGLLYGDIGLVFVWIFGLLFFLLGGLRDKRLETTSQPNQGIWLSAKNGLMVALLFGLLFALLSPIWLVSLSWLFLGLLMAVAAGFIYGWASLLKHLGLRWLLWQNGRMPLNYTHFLDYAASLVFLRKVGGGYIFMHRLLQDYFASLRPENENRLNLND